MQMKRFTLDRDGLTLQCRLQLPDASSFNLAILAHGLTGSMAEAHHLLPDVAAALNEAGIATLQFDFNGHGTSDGSLINMTLFNELEDYNHVLTYAKNLAGVNQLFLVGHSQGGLLSSLMAGMYHDWIARMVLFAPALELVDAANRGNILGGKFNPQAVSDDIMLKKGKKLGGWYVRGAQCIDVQDFASKFKKPVYIVQGTKDAALNPYGALRYQAMMTDATVQFSEGNDHCLKQNRSQFIPRVVKFLMEEEN